MPILKASIKHQRQSQKRRKINLAKKVQLKNAMKEMLKLAQGKKWDDFKKRLSQVTSIIDKAAKQGIIHKNNAGRKKSRLAHLLVAPK